MKETLYRWVSIAKRLPPDDSNEDFPKQYSVRIKGDDPRSGWVGGYIMTAQQIKDDLVYAEYSEWLEPLHQVDEDKDKEIADLKERIRELETWAKYDDWVESNYEYDDWANSYCKRDKTGKIMPFSGGIKEMDIRREFIKLNNL